MRFFIDPKTVSLVIIFFFCDLSSKMAQGRCHNEKSTYDVSSWIGLFHLQQCVIIEIGDSLCAIFIETQPNNDLERNGNSTGDNCKVNEYFLGMCLCEDLRSWKWCSEQLTHERPDDCTFSEATSNATTDARVHRRLCDIPHIIQQKTKCNCLQSLASNQLTSVNGFPTCAPSDLPKSLCSPRSVCGIARCVPLTTDGIHSVKCDAKCFQRQPFCERTGPDTTRQRQINGSWTNWDTPKCTNSCGSGVLQSSATCLNPKTHHPSFDCLGPDLTCCPKNAEKCTCQVVVNQKSMLVKRNSNVCHSYIACPKSFPGKFNNYLKNDDNGFSVAREKSKRKQVWKSDPIIKIIPRPPQDELYVEFIPEQSRYGNALTSLLKARRKNKRKTKRLHKQEKKSGRKRRRVAFRRRRLLTVFRYFEINQYGNGMRMDGEYEDDDEDDETDDNLDEDIRLEEDTESNENLQTTTAKDSEDDEMKNKISIDSKKMDSLRINGNSECRSRGTFLVLMPIFCFLI